jgi:hypothetical protein
MIIMDDMPEVLHPHAVDHQEPMGDHRIYHQGQKTNE